MEGTVKVLETGLILLNEGAGVPYIRQSRKSDWWWSSVWWLKEIETEGKVREMTIEGAEHIDRYREHERRILKAMRLGSTYDEAFFDRVFATKLWPGQKHAASVMAASKFFCLSDAVGLGKSYSAWAALLLLHHLKRIRHVVIVTQTTLKFQWQSEIERGTSPSVRENYPVVVVHGDRRQRDRAYAQDAFCWIVNYESLQVDYQRRGFPFKHVIDAVVFDEAWVLKNWTTKRNRAMREVFQEARYRYALNASPITQGFEDFFGIFAVLQSLVFMCWQTFKERYMRYYLIRLRNGRAFQKPIGYKDITGLRRKIAPYIMRRTVRDMGWTSPQITVTPYWVDLLPDQKAVYNAVIKGEANPLETVVRARVACLYTEKTPPAKSPKFKELYTLLTEALAGEKVLVFSESKTWLRAVLPHLTKEMKALMIAGDDDAADRAAKVDSFTSGNARVLLCTAAGEAGLNLQAADVVINVDLPWSAERLYQRVGRVRPYQGGETRHIRVLNVLARDTIEERVIQRIQEKVGYVSRFFLDNPQDLTGVFQTEKLMEIL